MSVQNQNLKRVASLCGNSFLQRIWSGAHYALEWYIYRGSVVTDMELNSSQFLLLSLLHSLITGDILSSLLLADICHRVLQLQSDYLRVWLCKDFKFPQQHVERALALLHQLLESGGMKLPPHVVRIMCSLAEEHRVHDAGLMSPSTADCTGAISSRLEEAVVANNTRDVIALAFAGGDVNGLTQSGDSLVHIAARVGSCSSIAALGFLEADMDALNSRNATPLEEAIRNNSVISVKALLSAGAKVDRRLFHGDTYLHIAADGGHSGVLAALLEYGIGVDTKNDHDETPLYRAVKGGGSDVVEMLLNKGANPGICPSDKTLLEIAVDSENVEVFKALTKRETNFVSKHDDSVFHLAARSGNTEMLKVVEQIGLPPNLKNKFGLKPLHVARNPLALKTMIRMGMDVNDKTDNGETALHLASARGSLELVKALFTEGANVDALDKEGTTALMVAAKYSKEDVVTFLLINKANHKIQNREGRTALHYAAERGCPRIATSLLLAGAGVDVLDKEGHTPAFLAASNRKLEVLRLMVVMDQIGVGILYREARSGNVDVVTALLDAGAAVDARDQDQRTALHHAAEGGHREVVTALIDAGAAVDTRDQNQRTALHLAAKGGHREVVTALLDAGAAVGTRDQLQRTALHHAAEGGHTATATALLDRGADPAAKDSYGTTPLMLASGTGHLAVVQLLLGRGAPVNDRNRGGCTALTWANWYKNTAVADWLRARGRTE